MSSFRTDAAQKKYKDYVKNGGLKNGCNLCKSPSIEEFEHWRIIENIFPYDKIAVKHDMIIPKRHIKEKELSSKETDELGILKKNYISDNYGYIIEATLKNKSIPSHFHLHLITARSD